MLFVKVNFFKKIIVVLIVTLNLFAQEKLYESNYWKKLLYVTDDVSNISSKEFFLSNNFTLENELNTTINLLNSKDGNAIACNFPARYLWIKDQVDIPDFNLSKCQKLQKFIKGFQKDTINIVFTSEYANNPSSAFGHIMIAFRDFNSSFETADVVHFAAETGEDKLFKYAYRGFSGKYNAYFIREPFFKKIYEYNTLEQRYMYIYTLDFTKEEILRIIYHLYELRKATFKYYFLSVNCASETLKLLEIADRKNTNSIDSYTLPIDVVKSYSSKIKNITNFKPLIVKIDSLKDSMNNDEKSIFNKIIKNNSDVSNSLPNIVKEALVYYTEFNFRKLRRVYKNYDDVMNLNYKPTKIKDETIEPLSRTKPSKLTLSWQKDNKVLLSYRPVLIDIFDIQSDKLQVSESSVLNTKLILKDGKLNLQNLDFLSIKAYTRQLGFYNPSSWEIYSGINRKNKTNHLQFESEFGTGLTKGFNHTNIASIIDAGFDISSRQSDLYLKPNISLFHYFTDNIKLGINSSYKQGFNGHYYDNNLFLTTKLQDMILTTKLSNTSFEDTFSVSIGYNY